jgi:hypothetical protein
MSGFWEFFEYGFVGGAAVFSMTLIGVLLGFVSGFFLEILRIDKRILKVIAPALNQESKPQVRLEDVLAATGCVIGFVVSLSTFVIRILWSL